MNAQCPNCGASLKQYWHKLTPLLINALIKFRYAVNLHQRNQIHLIKDMKGTDFELSPHEWNNWTKLRFHGLVAKYKENGDWKRGYWLLTHRGAEFVAGRLEVPESVQTFRNKVISHSEKQVTVKGVLGTQPYLEDLQDIKYDLFTPAEALD